MTRFDSRSHLSRELLLKLYVEESLSSADIAAQLGCGETTILRALEKFNIPKRSKHDYRFEVLQGELEQLYVVEGLSELEIAKRYNTSQLTISRRLREFGIQTRRVGTRAAYTVPSRVLASWSPNLAYAVGLLATDGTLNKDRVRVEFVSTDKELIELYLCALELVDVHVVITKRLLRKTVYCVKISDPQLRSFLEGIGLTPQKSKTLKALQIPDDVFVDFLRGVFDGDGSLHLSSSWVKRYRYLRCELCSASRSFRNWIAHKITELSGLEGTMRTRSLGRYHYVTFIVSQAIALGEWLYASPDGLSLSRKRHIWEKARIKANSRRQK